MNTFSAGASIKYGWETFKKRPWLFIGVTLLIVLLSSLMGALTEDNPNDAFEILVMIAATVIGLLIEMGLIAFALKAHDDVEKASVRDLWHPQRFWPYLGVKILTGIIVVIGLILLIVPGIIAALALIFATYLVIDRNLGPIEAIKESVRLTKGRRWTLLLLVLMVVGLNILGALAVLVGLLVTIPVSLLAIAHAYRTIVRTASA